MTEPDAPLPLLSSRMLRHLPAGERAAQRGARRGELVRIRAGVFADRAEWMDADADATALARIHAVVATRRSSIVLSHESAARMHRLPIARPWPTTVHITEPPRSGRRSARGVTVHRAELADHEIVEIDGLLVTSLARTLIDLARSAPTIDALVAIDAARDVRAPLIDRDDLMSALDRIPSRGSARAASIIGFSSDQAMSPNETCGRYAVHVLGFPKPVEQYEVLVAGGRSRFLDLAWPRHRAGLEIDGRSKYVATSAETIWKEKQREAELADVGVREGHLVWADWHRLHRVDVRVRALGVPRRPVPIPRSLFDLP